MTEETLFHLVLEQNADERAAFLARACGDDASLQRRIEQLLHAHDYPAGFLAGSPLPDAKVQPAPSTVISAGARIGPYRLREPIGEGGMGVVYLAEQEEPLHRRVAVKVIKPGMDSRHVIARFEAERQALALMEHPNIARVLDAGTSDGRPYFVMELCRGIPITDYCDRANLDTTQRLELFVTVCAAVQHAHLKGIIHRDLKPSNVLVVCSDEEASGTAVVKVIDFGIAKALGQTLTDKTVDTGAAQVLGTPLYMSPEQTEMSGDVDTRSDIYSLGVLLYEMLTSVTPFDRQRMSAASYHEVLRIIREEDPPRPSTRLSTLGAAATTMTALRGTDARRLRRLLRGELDWIVMRALDKERDRRYQTAAALAADVQRYLRNEPVHACPPSVWYRLRKFAGKHRTALMVATCLFLGVIALAGAIGWQMRDRAEQRAQRVRRIEDALTAARTLMGEYKLAAARRQLAEARAHIGEDSADAPALAATVRAADRALDRFERFFTLVNRAVDPEVSQDQAAGRTAQLLLEALALYPVFDDSAGEDPLNGGMLASTDIENIRRTACQQLLWLAGDVLDRRAEHRTAERLSPEQAAHAALAYLHQAESAHGTSRTFYEFRASAYYELGQTRLAEADAERARNTAAAVAWDYYLAGGAAQRARKKDEAVRAYQAALRLEPKHYGALLWMGFCLNELGVGREDYTAAAVAFTGCIMLRSAHGRPYFGRGYANYMLQQWDAALADYTRAIELEPQRARTWNNRGAVHAQLKLWDRALEDYAQALKLDPEGMALSVAGGRADLYFAQGKTEQALAAYSEAIALKPTEARWWEYRGRAYAKLDRLAEAIDDFTHAVDCDPKLIFAWFERGLIYERLNQLHKAIDDFTKVIESNVETTNPRFVLARVHRGNAYARLGQTERGIADFTEALKRDARCLDAVVNRGLAHRDRKEWPEAIADFARALELDAGCVRAWFHRGNVYRTHGQWQKAIDDYSQAVRCDPNHASAWANRADAYTRLGRLEPALDDYSHAVKLDAKEAYWWEARGLIHAKLRRWKESHADFSQALKVDPRFVSSWSNRGAINERLGRPDAALADYSEAVRRDARWAAAWYGRGKLRLQLGYFIEAIPDFSRAIELNYVNLADPRTGRAHALAALGLWVSRGVAPY
jgi:tetratricopeptide (TPR) repeat protein/serine/threonine protein kinase